MGGTCFPFFICVVRIGHEFCSASSVAGLIAFVSSPRITSIPTIFGDSAMSWILCVAEFAQIFDRSYAYHPTAKQRHRSKTSSKSRFANVFSFCLMVVMGIPLWRDCQIGGLALHFKRKSSDHNTFMITPNKCE